jgi:hypothetical protein
VHEAKAAALTAERDELLGVTVFAAHAQKPVLKTAALQIRRESSSMSSVASGRWRA